MSFVLLLPYVHGTNNFHSHHLVIAGIAAGALFSFSLTDYLVRDCQCLLLTAAFLLSGPLS
jgi:hypothetical protein